MEARKLLMIVALVFAVLMMGRCSNDPHRTALPFGSTDLSSVESALARLPADERALVEDYVKRSNGDVLPAQFADPDDPLTARTFAEAIELQRNWVKKMAANDAHMAKIDAAREARIEPLRQLVNASIIKTEILSRSDYEGRQHPSYAGQSRPVDPSPVFLLRVRVHNIGSEGVAALTGSLHARDREAYLPLNLCWIDLQGEELGVGAIKEFECGGGSQIASDQQRAFVANPPGRFTVEWEPHHIKLSSGRELDAGL